MIERYTRPVMGSLWSEEKKLSTWLEVETVVCEEMEALGLCPEGTGRKVRENARFDSSRIKQLELSIKHDVLAFITNVAEHLGDESRFFHFGLTSSDLLDTSQALLCREACLLIEGELENLIGVLRELALRHKDTVMVGRTHGMHAEPITFGLKVLVWYEESKRNLGRIRNARQSISTAKISGAVGTFSHVPPDVEERVCKRLELVPEPAATQVVQRDRHAELLTSLALTAASLEKFAMELRHLQRTEVLEVEESFAKDQQGSSAMPHKRNPIHCERICGLARVVRTNAMAGLENVALWHERDISHSSVERVIIPDSFILVDYVLAMLTSTLKELKIHPERMRQNLEKSKDLVFSQRLLLELARRGMRREDAYRLVQGLATEAHESGTSLKHVAVRNEEVSAQLDPETLENCFDLDYLLRNVKRIYERVLARQ
ncbi:MAG: adenylosuccinate lyase [Candidatus Eiseniibacteriota bacterium]|nr:MAG: adenylosuccinate lyase [Candidatus Eisenbacteria bacterium]